MLEIDQRSRLRQLLIKHEGLRLKSYVDTQGKTTIGVGRNLTDVGISSDEAMQLLTNDLTRIEQEANALPWYGSLSPNRQNVILSMIFNMGFNGLLKFQGMISALTYANWNKAADEMLNSKWAAQVGQRALDLAELIRKG